MVYHRDDTGQIYPFKLQRTYDRSPWHPPRIWPKSFVHPAPPNMETQNLARPHHGTKDWAVDDPELKRLVGCFVGRLSRPYGLSQTVQEEICQEVFLRLLQKKTPSDDHPRFCSSFLFQTARNVVRETNRKSSRIDHREISGETADPQVEGTRSWLEQAVVSDLPDPQRSSCSLEVSRAIRRCLSQLNPARRRAVTLRLLGFRVKEIANRFEWSPKSAEGRILRGLIQLRTCLRNKGLQP